MDTKCVPLVADFCYDRDKTKQKKIKLMVMKPVRLP